MNIRDQAVRAAELVKQAQEMGLSQGEIRKLLALRPEVYAPLAVLLEPKEKPE